jgi:hypothetical protein
MVGRTHAQSDRPFPEQRHWPLSLRSPRSTTITPSAQTASAASSTNRNMPHDQHGWSYRHPQRCRPCRVRVHRQHDQVEALHQIRVRSGLGLRPGPPRAHSPPVASNRLTRRHWPGDRGLLRRRGWSRLSTAKPTKEPCGWPGCGVRGTHEPPPCRTEPLPINGSVTRTTRTSGAGGGQLNPCRTRRSW